MSQFDRVSWQEARELEQQAFFAAEEGDVESLREALEGGASPNAMDSGGRTPLMLAARAGHIEAVDALLPVSRLDLLCHQGAGEIRDDWAATFSPAFARRPEDAVSALEMAICGDAHLAPSGGPEEKTRLLIVERVAAAAREQGCLDLGRALSHAKTSGVALRFEAAALADPLAAASEKAAKLWGARLPRLAAARERAILVEAARAPSALQKAAKASDHALQGPREESAADQTQKAAARRI
jgi:hypothetical protein